MIVTDKETAMIPYYVHEGEMNRMERVNNRWFIAFLVVLISLIATNVCWIVYENQFEEIVTTESYSAEADGNSNAVLNTGEGDVNIGFQGESDEDY